MADIPNEVVTAQEAYKESILQEVAIERAQFEQKVIQEVEKRLIKHNDMIKIVLQDMTDEFDLKMGRMQMECEEAKRKCEEAKKECEDVKRQCIENSTQQFKSSNSMIEMMRMLMDNGIRKQTKLDDLPPPPPPPELNYDSDRQGLHKAFPRLSENMRGSTENHISEEELRLLQLDKTQLEEQQEALEVLRKQKEKDTAISRFFQTQNKASKEQLEHEHERELERKHKEGLAQNQKNREIFQKKSFLNMNGTRSQTTFATQHPTFQPFSQARPQTTTFAPLARFGG